MLNKEEVKKIAALSRIGINNEEVEKYQKDLSAVLDYFKKLEELDTSNINPIEHITGVNNITREDNVGEFEERKEIIKLFPEEKDGYDKVKSVL